MVICLTLTGDEAVGGGFGRAQHVALARAKDDGGFDVERVDVRWDLQHEGQAEGLHHAQIARFLRERGVEVVVTGHMGDGMLRMLDSMKVRVYQGEGPLAAVLDAAAAESAGA